MAEELELDAELIAGVREEVAEAEIGAFFGRAMGEVMRRVPGELITGPVVAVYHVDAGDRFDVTIGMPVSVRPDDPGLDVAELPASRALRVTHRGEYPRLREAYADLRAAFASRGLPMPFAWERYVVGPADVADPADYITEVVAPLP